MLRISSLLHVAKHHVCEYTCVRLAWHHVSWPLTSHYTACLTLISRTPFDVQGLLSATLHAEDPSQIIIMQLQLRLQALCMCTATSPCTWFDTCPHTRLNLMFCCQAALFPSSCRACRRRAKRSLNSTATRGASVYLECAKARSWQGQWTGHATGGNPTAPPWQDRCYRAVCWGQVVAEKWWPPPRLWRRTRHRKQKCWLQAQHSMWLLLAMRLLGCAHVGHMVSLRSRAGALRGSI